MRNIVVPAPLRPAAVRSHPVRIAQVFDHPEEILSLIERRGPYQTTAAFHNLGETLGARAASAPWFKSHLEDPLLLDNPRWHVAAREAFGAAIVRPLIVAVNLNAATPLGVPHLDLPRFRGFGAPEIPVWLLLNMAHSGLFDDWMVPYASGLCWFNRDESGAFECWPQGLDAPSLLEPAPMWNRGVVSDNEFMWHRVGAIGSSADQTEIASLMHYNNTLQSDGSGSWRMMRGEQELRRFSPAHIRISLLWKANVFTDEAHLASFEDDRLDLSVETVTDIYHENLRERGITVVIPADPLQDDDWRELLMASYAPPIGHLG